MHLRWTAQGVVAELSGEVNAALLPRVAAMRLLLQDWGQGAVVDARAVTSIDAAGLDAVCALVLAGRSLLVLQPSTCFLRLLRAMALAGCGPSVQALGPREQGVVILTASGDSDRA